MIELKSGNILLLSVKDVIEYGHWDESLKWYGQVRLKPECKEESVFPMYQINNLYSKNWHKPLQEGTLRFFVKEPSQEDLNYPWIDSDLTHLFDFL